MRWAESRSWLNMDFTLGANAPDMAILIAIRRPITASNQTLETLAPRLVMLDLSYGTPRYRAISALTRVFSTPAKDVESMPNLPATSTKNALVTCPPRE